MKIARDDKISIALKIGSSYIDSKGRVSKDANWVSCGEEERLFSRYEYIHDESVEVCEKNKC
jgi:hypothetical protein